MDFTDLQCYINLKDSSTLNEACNIKVQTRYKIENSYISYDKEVRNYKIRYSIVRASLCLMDGMFLKELNSEE